MHYNQIKGYNKLKNARFFYPLGPQKEKILLVILNGEPVQTITHTAAPRQSGVKVEDICGKDTLKQFEGGDMRREEALKILREHKQELAERYGVTRIGIFGSVARDEATEGSDMDVVVEMARPDLFFMVHIKKILESAMHCRVDLVHYPDRINAFLRRRIDEEAVYA
jgi:predicted nucleotidyltransferase